MLLGQHSPSAHGGVRPQKIDVGALHAPGPARGGKLSTRKKGHETIQILWYFGSFNHPICLMMKPSFHPIPAFLPWFFVNPKDFTIPTWWLNVPFENHGSLDLLSSSYRFTPKIFGIHVTIARELREFIKGKNRWFNNNTTILIIVITEGSLEVKLPTIWTDENQRWEESERREE